MSTIFAENTPSIFKKTLSIMSLEIFKLLAIIVLFEVFLQWFAPEYKNSIHDREFTGGHPIHMKSPGYRGPEVSIQKKPNEFRLLAMGDSTTFGTGVATNTTWPAQLATFFHAHYPQVTYLNTALPAMDIKRAKKAYQEIWSTYRPDKLILAVSNNMISFGWIRRNAVPALPSNPHLQPIPKTWSHYLKTTFYRTYHKFALPSWLSINSQRILFLLHLTHLNISANAPFGPILAFGWKQAGIPPSLSEDAWKIFEKDLIALNDEVKHDGRSLLVIYLPTRFMVFDHWFDNDKWVPKARLSIDPEKKIEVICQTRGISYMKFTQTLHEKRKKIAEQEHRFAPLYVPFDFMHLDEDGHHAVAEALFAASQ